MIVELTVDVNVDVGVLNVWRDVAVVLTDVVAVVLFDVVAVVEVVIVDVTELEADEVPVVKSQFVYAPDWNSKSARFSAADVVSHLLNGLPPVESFKIPDGLHCTVPNVDDTYGVMSTRIWFRMMAAAVHFVWSANRSMFWPSVSISF